MLMPAAHAHACSSCSCLQLMLMPAAHAHACSSCSCLQLILMPAAHTHAQHAPSLPRAGGLNRRSSPHARPIDHARITRSVSFSGMVYTGTMASRQNSRSTLSGRDVLGSATGSACVPRAWGFGVPGTPNPMSQRWQANTHTHTQWPLTAPAHAADAAPASACGLESERMATNSS